MEQVKNIVSDVIGRISSGQGASPQEIQALWEKISKDGASKVTDFKNGCVTVSADSSLRLVRLNLNREIFLKEMKKEFPSIDKIIFKIKTP